MLYIKIGSIFDFPVDSYVNAVNCVGIMGKGLAKVFKDKFPNLFTAYRKCCDNKELKLGNIFTFYDENSKKYIFNFPTKDHWQENSRIENIIFTLPRLGYLLRDLNVKSCAIPMLGAGLGNLDKDEVLRVFIQWNTYYKDIIGSKEIYISTGLN